MRRTENVELTVLCLIQQNDKYLLQNRLKKDWKGLTLPAVPNMALFDRTAKQWRDKNLHKKDNLAGIRIRSIIAS